MKCKTCGSELAVDADICPVCGEPNETGYTSYIRTMEELAYEYGLGAQEEEPADLPGLFLEYKSKRTKLGQAIHAPQEQKPVSSVKGTPTLDLEEYVRLLGAATADAISAPDEQNDREGEDEHPVVTSRKVPESRELHPVLQRIDSLIEKPADKLLEKIHEKYPQPTRAKGSAAGERLMLLAAVLGAGVVLIALIVLVAASIAPDISGEWLVASTSSGESFTVEFTNSGEVIARAYIDGVENIYMTGEYKVRRSNGYNLLTITYDDGEEKKLYYVIDGKSGSFTNVDSGKSDTYTRVK